MNAKDAFCLDKWITLNRIRDPKLPDTHSALRINRVDEQYLLTQIPRVIRHRRRFGIVSNEIKGVQLAEFRVKIEKNGEKMEDRTGRILFRRFRCRVWNIGLYKQI